MAPHNRPTLHRTPTSAGLWAFRASSMAPGSRKMAISSTALLAAPRSGSSRRCSSSIPLSKFSLKVGARDRRRAKGAACGPADGGFACGQAGRGGGSAGEQVGRQGSLRGRSPGGAGGGGSGRRQRGRAGSEGGPGGRAGRHRHTSKQHGTAQPCRGSDLQLPASCTWAMVLKVSLRAVRCRETGCDELRRLRQRQRQGLSAGGPNWQREVGLWLLGGVRPSCFDCSRSINDQGAGAGS